MYTIIVTTPAIIKAIEQDLNLPLLNIATPVIITKTPIIYPIGDITLRNFEHKSFKVSLNCSYNAKTLEYISGVVLLSA